MYLYREMNFLLLGYKIEKMNQLECYLRGTENIQGNCGSVFVGYLYN